MFGRRPNVAATIFVGALTRSPLLRREGAVTEPAASKS